MSVGGFIALSYVIGIASLLDAYRRPYTDWQYADRDRGYWATTGVFMTMFALGLLFGILYLILVLPRFGQSSGGSSTTHNDFRKR